MPQSRTRGFYLQKTVECIVSLSRSLNVVLVPPVFLAWQRTELVIERMATQKSELQIFVYTLERVPMQMTSNTVVVTDTSDVSSVDLRVQGHVAFHVETPRFIAEAVMMVEARKESAPREVGFACDGETLRSYQCACLLASLVYHRACIMPDSRRMVNVARKELT